MEVRILVNMKSGLQWSFDALRKAVTKHWDTCDRNVTYQFCTSPSDGTKKAVAAVKDGVDVVLAAGGDGTVNSIGRALIGTNTAIGVIPSGSGNGFARHFGIPLGLQKAAASLAAGRVKSIDVGTVNGQPFLVTCSMAWDASIVRSFERSRVRGILPYIFAGVNEFIMYKPQPVWVSIDGTEEVLYRDPIVLTVANLSQYGGGAVIAPGALSDDGELECIIALNSDLPQLMVNFPRLFDGSVDRIRELVSVRFRNMHIRRGHNSDIQVDGELVRAGRDISIGIMPAALKVLVPGGSENR